ncbi:MAG: glutamine--fructose-6-phosphate transaminase (isomerizing) [Desulfobulbaceae bacterium]|jgi:glucosamine--fructose-6-phosphate aminotransferase (isomerizing)|nr:glutamine--fructose-6-phosphate transaminase (isomerizing) [Desulfobulbaceae bacterium]
MCGIVGYVGPRRVVPIVLEGLKHLEYRGYDSAGIVFLEDDGLQKYRSEGKLANLVEIMDEVDTRSRIGMGHTRWATHGAPSEGNAHPHSDCTGELVVVHNGIIENYIQLRNLLRDKGHVFTSETDTEVLAHLIEEYLDGDLVQAVTLAMQDVVGAYALGVMWAQEPDKIVAVRNQSPLVLGVKEGGGSFMASDVPALLPYTNKVVYLEDGDMAILTEDSCDIFSLADGSPRDRPVQEILWNAGMAEKSGYRHFMLKEIFEQPLAITSTLRGRLEVETGVVNLPEIGLSDGELQSIKRIFLVACGTSWHAALVAKYWLEKWVRIPVEVDIASEFRYRTLLLDEHVMVIPISQSGETADTLAGLRLAKELGAKVISICNVLGSTITRESHGTIYTHAGPEIGVASTKAFTSQLAALFLLTMYMGQVRQSIEPAVARELGQGLLELPGIIEQELPRLHDELEVLAEEFVDSRDFLYLGRGIHFPIALEGALKLKEISYIHAEGYAAGELKHGPIALIDKDMPVLALTPPNEVYSKVISNVEEVKARHGRLILVGHHDNGDLAEIADDCIFLPTVHPEMQPILYTIPLQILSYHIARLRGCDVDQPRNLAKSVTVE